MSAESENGTAPQPVAKAQTLSPASSMMMDTIRIIVSSFIESILVISEPPVGIFQLRASSGSVRTIL